MKRLIDNKSIDREVDKDLDDIKENIRRISTRKDIREESLKEEVVKREWNIYHKVLMVAASGTGIAALAYAIYKYNS